MFYFWKFIQFIYRYIYSIYKDIIYYIIVVSKIICIYFSKIFIYLYYYFLKRFSSFLQTIWPTFLPKNNSIMYGYLLDILRLILSTSKFNKYKYKARSVGGWGICYFVISHTFIKYFILLTPCKRFFYFILYQTTRKIKKLLLKIINKYQFAIVNI